MLTLRKTKGRARRLEGEHQPEIVIVESKVAVRALRKASQGMKANDRIVGMAPRHFREAFALMREHFLVVGRLTPYCLRRGGASSFFLHCNRMERTMLRGRWGTLQSAKIYVTEVLSSVATLRLSKKQLSLIHEASKHLEALM